MPRSRNDPYKRKCAQALNHLAGAVLDLNDVYKAFDAQRDMLSKLPEDAQAPDHEATLQRYTEMTEEMKSAMMGAAVVRQSIIAFIGKAWELDEETILVYMG